MTDLTVERWPLGRLIPYVRNAKTHGAEQVARIAASMAEFGWTAPILATSDGAADDPPRRRRPHPPVLRNQEPGLVESARQKSPKMCFQLGLECANLEHAHRNIFHCYG
ncbi:MAG: hypothetical protein U9N14_03985 [Pseudomonadota bacterium]|nr:hypothetical protein [Pseudomonadota bacterium]